MDNGKLKFIATIDDSDFNKKLNSMQKGVDAIDKNFQSNTLKNVQLTKEQQRAFEAYSNTLKGAQENLKNATDPTYIALYKKQIEQTTTAMQNLVDTANKQPKLPKADFKVTPYNSVGNSIGQNQDALIGFKERLIDEKDINNSKQLNKNIQQLEGDIKRATNVGKKGFDELGNAIPTKKTNSFISILKNFAGVFGIVAGVGLITKGIKDTIRTIIDFDKSMVNMSAISGKSRADLSGLEMEIRRVASTSLNTANAVADMATELIKLGSTPDGVKALLKPVNDLSIATALSADKTAVLLKGTLNAFQETEGQATKYADVIAKALNLTALDATKFGDAFKFIGATASVAGISVERTSALIGVLVDNNVQASTAGRVLSSVFGRLAKDGKDFDTELEKVRTSTNQLGQASKSLGAEGARLGVILANNKDRLKELTTQLENSGGSLAKLTEAQLSSVGARFNILTSAWTEFVLAVDSGNGVIAGTLKAIADLGTMFISAITPSETLTKSMYQQQVSLNLLIGRITASNVKENERLNLINELKNTYPEFISLIKDEDFSNGNLINTLKGVNAQYEKRILLQKQVEAENDIFKDLEKSVDKVASRTTTLYKTLDEIKRRRNLDIEIDINNIDESARKIQELIRGNSQNNKDRQGALDDIYQIKRNRLVLKEQTEDVKKLNEEYKAQQDLTNSIQKNLGIMTEDEKQRALDAKSYADQVKSALKTAESFGGKVGKDFDIFNLESINKFIESKTQVNALETKTKDLTSQRFSLLDKINKIERDLNISVLGDREQALQRIVDKYIEIRKEAFKLGVSQEKINQLEARETILVNYKLDTDDLVKNLQEQQKYYEEFENAKNKVGVEKAKEMYKDLIDVNKSYYNILDEEQSKLDPNNLTDKERNRYAVLTKLLVDYDAERNKKERESLAELYSMTQSYEDKILALRTDYLKKRSKLENDFTGKDLEDKLSILEKEFQGKVGNIISDLADEKGFGTSITQGFIGATKQIISAQIDSLRNYLKESKSLTAIQVKEINNIIKGLDEKLYNATDSGSGGALRILNTQIKGLQASLKSLNDRKSFLESLKLPESAVELAQIEAKIKAINVSLNSLAGAKAKAISEEFSNISNIFSNLASNFEGISESTANMFRNLSKISNIASSVSNLFSEMKAFNEAQSSEGGASFAQTLSAGASLVGAVFSVTSLITGALDKAQKAEDRGAQLRIQSYIKTLEFERELARLETERIRRNAVSLSDRIKEEDSVNREVLIKQRQLAELQNRLNLFSDFYVSSELGNLNGNFNRLFNGLDLQKLYDDLKKIRESGKEFTKEQAEQFSILDKFLVGGNRSWKELQQVLNNLTNDYIRDDLRAYVEEAIKLAKELEEAGYSLDDLQRTFRELATGTSVDDLSNKFADAFRKGEDAVYSFGQTMEDVIKNAIIESFKNEYIVKEIDAFFKTFGDSFLKGNATPEELENIRKEAEEIAKRLQAQFDLLNSGLGIDFGSGELGGGAKDSVKRITETQADRFIGILQGVQVGVIGIDKILTENKNYLSSSLNELVAINVNTRRTADSNDSIDNKMSQLINAVQNNQNQNQSLGL